jgi:serine protease Do
MKISLIILSCVLVISSTLSGFFIYNLNQQINELELNMENQFVDMTREIELTRETFIDMLKVSQDKYELALTNQAASLADYKASTDNMVSIIQDSITSTGSKLGSVNSQISQIRDNIIFSGDLYEKVKESVVTISYNGDLIGSGFYIEKSHSIVTAYHVAKKADYLMARFYNGVYVKAFVVAYSEELDIAILRIGFDSTGIIMNPGDSFFMQFTGVNLANSSDVRPGDPVFVIGSPGDNEEHRMGLKGTLTTGVISQINRCSSVEGEFRTNLLQFDAAVNFGNSGGPLFNKKGEVIGMVIARMNPLIGDGISMAVTSNQIQKVENSAVSFDPSAEIPIEPTDKYQYPWSGITVVDNKEISVSYLGAYVTSVNGPAISAGVQIGDIITGTDEYEIRNSDEYYCFLADYYDVGDAVTLKIQRGEENVAVSLVIQENL